MKNWVARRRRDSGGFLLVFVTACSQPSPAQEPKTEASKPSAASVPNPSPSEPVAPPLPQLGTGTFAPVEHETPIVGTVTAAEQTGEIQTLLVTIPDTAVAVLHSAEAFVTIEDERSLLSVLGAHGTGVREVWLRRRANQASPATGSSVSSAATVGDASGLRPAEVHVYTRAKMDHFSEASVPGQHYRIAVDLPQAPLKSNKVLVQKYLGAIAAAVPADSPVLGLLTSQSTPQVPSARELEQEWTEMMRLTSGYASIEAALATSPSLRDVVAPKTGTVALKALTPPRLQRHPWPEMSKALPATNSVEVLASLTPAEFYYLRARSFEAFQSLLARVDELVSPVLGITTQRREVLDLNERYSLELGLPEGELSAVLGPHLISSLAVVGSDPLLRQGSDVSIVMAAPNAAALLAALAVRRAELGQRVQLKQTVWTHAGVEVKTSASANGEIRQHVAVHNAPDGGAYVLVSNSPNAVKRIVDVWVGKGTKLSDEADFQYMLRRDQNVKDDVLAYAGDRFVAEVVSPRQRILEARRQVAKSELLNVGYAGLLHAQVYGALPADAASLAKTEWRGLRLKHSTSEAIAYSPTLGPQSSWGSAARLTSIIDLPTPERVSKIEQQAYQAFVLRYEQHWGENIDPIALRVTASSSALDAHVRILPVANTSDYSDIARYSGGGNTRRKPSVPALAAILAIGEDSELRSVLGQQGGRFLGTNLKLDWLGDWVEFGLADETLLAETAFAYGDFPHPPGANEQRKDSDFEMLARLPLYMSIDIKSAAGAALLLTRLRELATEAAPDVVRWGELKTNTQHKIVQVSFDEVNIYYCLSKERLTLATDLSTLQRVLTRDSQGRESPAVPATEEGGQLVIELEPRQEASALRLVAAWLAELGVREFGTDNWVAELLLRANPDIEADPQAYQELSLSHVGAVVVTPDGTSYRLADSGVLDPARGTAHAPTWPNLPVKGSTTEHMLRVLRRLRTEVSIDPEPGSQGVTSLRTRLLLLR